MNHCYTFYPLPFLLMQSCLPFFKKKEGRGRMLASNEHGKVYSTMTSPPLLFITQSYFKDPRGPLHEHTTQVRPIIHIYLSIKRVSR